MSLAEAETANRGEHARCSHPGILPSAWTWSVPGQPGYSMEVEHRASGGATELTRRGLAASATRVGVAGVPVAAAAWHQVEHIPDRRHQVDAPLAAVEKAGGQRVEVPDFPAVAVQHAEHR